MQGGIGDNFDDDDITMLEQISIDLAVQKKILLLYLNKDTFCDGENGITEALEVAKHKGIGIILVHEQDIDKGGCPLGKLEDKYTAGLLPVPV